MSGLVRKLILENSQSPGDIVMLTAALRDLHRCYPGTFQNGVSPADSHFLDCGSAAGVIDEWSREKTDS